MTANDFGGERAVVTGGASGIGLGTAELLASRGARVGVLDREAPPTGLLHARADVTDDTSVREGVGQLLGHLGGLDILVNCAGIGAEGGIEANDDDEWRRVLDVNVIGVARVTRACLPALRASAPSAVVNVSSIAATNGLPNRALYSASKGAVLSLTLAMAADLLPDGVRVNAVTPGTTDTPWVARLLASAPDPAAERAALCARQPHGRMVSVAEVAHAIAYLASPAAGSTTGAWLAVDGGMASLRLRPKS
ncbi:MAG: SDR family NAD(P)-dependent oxidoreductase [Acidimicrobiales bacterium]